MTVEERLDRLEFALVCLAATFAGKDYGSGAKESVAGDIAKFVSAYEGDDDREIVMDLRGYPYMSQVAEYLKKGGEKKRPADDHDEFHQRER